MFVQVTTHGNVSQYPLTMVRQTDRVMSQHESDFVQNGYTMFYGEPSISRYVCSEHNTGSVDGNYPASCGVVELCR